jgi:uncharacterized SAM-binding protein YcdF (DUF218 family)
LKKEESINTRDFKTKLLVLLGALISSIGFCLFLNIQSFPCHKETKLLLIERLTKFKPLPESSYNNFPKANNILYVVGGSQRSLKRKFKIAAELYHLGLCERILLLSGQGITEYDPSIGRNLTNDEWAANKLVDLGIKKEDIEPVVLKKGLLGTFSEARDISDIVLRRGYKNLILVTSSFHTMRTWLSFSEFLKDKGIIVYIYGSNDLISLNNLLIEYFKLIIYKNLILPISFFQIKVMSETQTFETASITTLEVLFIGSTHILLCYLKFSPRKRRREEENLFASLNWKQCILSSRSSGLVFKL